MTPLPITAAAVWSQLCQLSGLIAVVGVITRLTCRRRPHLAYALWMVVLAKALTPPVWSSNLSIARWIEQPTPPTWLVDDFQLVSDAARGAEPNSSRNTSTTNASTTKDSAASATHHQREGAAARSPAPSRQNAWLVAWLAGSAIVIACAAIVRRRRNQLLATATPADDALADLVRQLARRIGVRPPTVLVSDANLGPAVCGVLRTTLVLPRTVVDSELDIRAIIAHELVHLRRGDHWVVAVQLVTQAAWWFHPLVWWANRRICRVRESCCDVETVATLEAPPRKYAQTLVDVLDAKLCVRPLLGFPGVRPVEVTAARVKEILAMSDRLLTRTPSSHLLAALAFAALVLPGAAPVPADGGQATAPATTAAAPAEADPAASAAPPKPAKPILVLKYGDGKPDGKKSIAGAGEMIRFSMPEGQTNALKALRIHGARYGYPQPPDEDVEINILSEDMTEVLHTELVPYRLFKRQAQPRWMMIPFEDPVDLPDVFWVVLNFNAEATKGVYVSYDTSTKGEQSRVGVNDQDAAETEFQGDWMVQAVLAK